MTDSSQPPDRGRPWYADWRVWFCMVVLVVWGMLEWLFGLPFRLFDAIWPF